jgi:fucose permease
VTVSGPGTPVHPARAAYAGQLLFGIVMALLGAVLPELSARTGLGLAQAGSLFLVMNGCILAGSLALGPLIDRFGTKPPLALGPLLAAVGLTLFAIADGWRALLPGAALLGLGGGAVNGSSNTLVADLHDSQEARSAALNRLGVFFGIGAVLVPLAIGLALEAVGLPAILAGTVALCLLVAVHNAALALPPPKQPRHVPLAQAARLAREPFLLVFAALLFLQSGNEFLAGGYISTLLVRELDFSVRAAAAAMAGFWASLMLARVLLSRLARNIEGTRVLVACGLLTAAGATLLVSTRSEAAALLAVAWLGAGIAGVFPAALGIVGARYPAFTGTVFGLLLAAALSGGMLLPWLGGRVGEAHGLRTALAMVVVQSLAIAGLAAFSRRLPPPARAQARASAFSYAASRDA